MSKATEHPATSRRALLAGLPAVALAAAVAVPALAAEASPDAELIAACAAFTALWEQREQVWAILAASHEEEMRLDMESELLGDRAYDLADEIVGMRAATEAGKAAKARVASLLAPRNADDTVISEGDITGEVLWSLVTDHTGEAHILAPLTLAPAPAMPHPDADLLALCEQYLTSKHGDASEWFELLPDLSISPAEKEAAGQIMLERRDGAKGLLAQIAALPAHTQAGKAAKISILKEGWGVRHADGRYTPPPYANGYERVCWSLFADVTGGRA